MFNVADTKVNYSTMPITTRTIAKGVPPRVHEPKGKAKARPKQANTTEQSSKRVASEPDSEELEDATEPARVKKKRNTTPQQIEDSESEVELVGNAEPPDEDVESVDGTRNREELSNEQEVSTICPSLFMIVIKNETLKTFTVFQSSIPTFLCEDGY
jgi:hypothetical protein